MSNSEQYVHVLLFACPICERPLSATCVSVRSNLETAEAQWFTPHCHCGWTGELAGITATKHWVAPWRSKVQVLPGEAGSCEGNQFNNEAR
jgi:hypothetical protein